MRTFFPTFAEICYNSLEFREILQHREIIQKTVAQARPSDAMIIVLCSYSHVCFYYFYHSYPLLVFSYFRLLLFILQIFFFVNEMKI